MRHLVVVALIAFGTAQPSTVTPPAITPSAIDTPHLQIATFVDNRAGTRATLVADIRPKPKMHVYAPGQEQYIPVALKLHPTPLFTSARAKYPEGEKMLLEALNETALVYTKPFRITQDVTLTGQARKLLAADGALTIHGSLKYQACDDVICYLPKTVTLEWRVPITPTL